VQTMRQHPSFTGPALSCPQIYGTQEGHTTLDFQQPFIQPRAWSYQDDIRFPIRQTSHNYIFQISLNIRL